VKLDEIYKVVYISHSTISDDELSNELANIEQIASSNNNHNEISGCLVYCNHMFIQALEGPKSDVLNLIESIKEDQRHSGLTLIYAENIKQRSYKSWRQMKVISDESLLSKFSKSLEGLASLPLNTLPPSKIDEIIFHMSAFGEL